MKTVFFKILPPTILALLLSLVFIVPENTDLLPSAANPELPLDTAIPGWYGVKTQESEEERVTLSADTSFSKAIYHHINPITYQREAPSVNVSFVYSGSDLNNSIHRPERCLPAQGHLDMTGRDEIIELANSKALTFRRLSTRTPAAHPGEHSLHHIHYYVFVSSDTICSSHLERTFWDIYNRIVDGRVQRWAYIQIGSYWGEEIGITEQQADNYLHALIRDLVPLQIDWDAIKN